jgi:hypothetical protein
MAGGVRMKLTMTPGYIVETIFLDFRDVCAEDFDVVYEKLTSFCVDCKGRIRLGKGIVGTDNEDLNFVPPQRYDITPAPWNSHQQYIEIELPNPSADRQAYEIIRAAFITELKRRAKLIRRRIK